MSQDACRDPWKILTGQRWLRSHITTRATRAEVYSVRLGESALCPLLKHGQPHSHSPGAGKLCFLWVLKEESYGDTRGRGSFQPDSLEELAHHEGCVAPWQRAESAFWDRINLGRIPDITLDGPTFSGKYSNYKKHCEVSANILRLLWTIVISHQSISKFHKIWWNIV